MLLWIVYAGCPDSDAKTFAARPVGAISWTGIRASSSTFTSAPTNDVLPVPAYPLRTKIRSLIHLPKTNSPSKFIASFCELLGVNCNLLAIFWAKTENIILFFNFFGAKIYKIEKSCLYLQHKKT